MKNSLKMFEEMQKYNKFEFKYFKVNYNLQNISFCKHKKFYNLEINQQFHLISSKM